MKKLLVGLALVLGSGLMGCSNSNTPGGPGVENPKGFGVLPAENTFELHPPRLATVIQEGDTKTIAIAITRGKNFSQDVKLEVRDVPAGLKVKPVHTAIRANDNEVQIKLEAAKDAALGKHTITVIGTPEEGANAAATLNVVVEKP